MTSLFLVDVWGSGSLEFRGTVTSLASERLAHRSDQSAPDQRLVVCGRDATLRDLDLLINPRVLPLFEELAWNSHLAIGLRSSSAPYLVIVEMYSAPDDGEEVELRGRLVSTA